MCTSAYFAGKRGFEKSFHPYRTGNHISTGSKTPNQADNQGSGVTLNSSTKTFSGFGHDFAIHINSSDVIFEGMGAILDGGGYTQYGILVNNQSANNFNSLSSNPLGKISIKNITLINFVQAGILFNKVIDTLSGPGSNPSSITNVNASYNGDNSGIVLENSNGIEVSSNTVSNNHKINVGGLGYGISLVSSNNNNLIRNIADYNPEYGFKVEDSSSNTFSGNTATGNNLSGFYVYHSDSNTFTGNKGCYIWDNSSFIPSDINYCNSTPSPTGTPDPYSPPAAPS